MCGLLGIISPAIPVDCRLLTRLRDRLRHRGPDNGANWIEERGRVAFGHRRLSILDNSPAGHQPMATPDGSHVLVFNGEIYNFIELRAELEAKGCRFRTAGDTEVLLAALLEWGEAALERLNGMFAFALWDARERRIMLARDRFGEKPMFIGRGAFGTVVFASEMKAILGHPAMPVRISEKALTRYGQGVWYEDDEATFFDGIERLPPAHALWMQEDGTEIRRWRFWTPNYTNIDDSITPRAAVERFAELLRQSINLRLRSDVPVGSSLSGGLDSSVVVGLLSERRGHDAFAQNTFSAVFPDDPTLSEDREISAVVESTGVKSFTVVPDATGLMRESRLMHWHQEEPVLSASIYLQWCVARLARQNETTVLLDGQGADELLAGYQFYFPQYQLDLLDRGKLGLAERETMKFERRLRSVSSRYSQSTRRFNADVALPAKSLQALFRGMPSPVASVYSHDIVPQGPTFRLRKILAEALNFNSLPMLLRYADRNSMAFSREARLPYLDYDLVDFCLSLPDSILVRNGWQKWILRVAGAGVIPENIRWRADKVGYAAPLDIWLRGPIKDWAAERLHDPRLLDVDGFSLCAVQQQWQEHQKGMANNSWALWRWISLSEWFELAHRGWWQAGA